GVDEQQVRVIEDQRRAGDLCVTVLHVVVEEALANLVGLHVESFESACYVLVGAGCRDAAGDARPWGCRRRLPPSAASSLPPGPAAPGPAFGAAGAPARGLLTGRNRQPPRTIRRSLGSRSFSSRSAPCAVGS